MFQGEEKSQGFIKEKQKQKQKQKTQACKNCFKRIMIIAGKLKLFLFLRDWLLEATLEGGKSSLL